MQAKKTTYHFHSLSRVLLVIGIVVFINVLISPIAVRFDMTQGKIYTISRSTKKIVNNLKKPVTLKVYISDPQELPDDKISIRQDVLDLVDEYKKIGGSNIIIEKINPTGNDTLTQEAMSYGIVPLQGGLSKQTEIAIKLYFAGIAIAYEDASIAIPEITDISNLEYEIIAGINKLTREKVPSIGIVSGHDETLLADIQEALKKEYDVKDIATTNLVAIPDSYDVLIIAGPKKDFSEIEKYALDQFVMRGGKLAILMDGVDINDDYLMATPGNLSLNSLLEAYGVKVNSDVVLDPYSNAFLPFRSSDNGGGLLMKYPAFPVIMHDGFSKENVISGKLFSMSFPFPSSLTVAKRNAETKIVELVKTSGESFAIDGNNAILSPDQINKMPATNKKEHTLAVLITGAIDSAFKGKSIPGKDAAPNDFIPDMVAGNIFVISSNRFLNVDYMKYLINSMQTLSENFILFANAIDVLAQGDALVDIRSRNLANRPLNPVTEQNASYIKYGNILAGAVLSLLVGGIAYFKRKHDGKKARERYI